MQQERIIRYCRYCHLPIPHEKDRYLQFCTKECLYLYKNTTTNGNFLVRYCLNCGKLLEDKEDYYFRESWYVTLKESFCSSNCFTLFQESKNNYWVSRIPVTPVKKKKRV
ncbi:MAG: hypothetical protein V1915_01965 [Candidatus Bathyarchaeota archaeon]